MNGSATISSTKIEIVTMEIACAVSYRR